MPTSIIPDSESVHDADDEVGEDDETTQEPMRSNAERAVSKETKSITSQVLRKHDHSNPSISNDDERTLDWVDLEMVDTAASPHWSVHGIGEADIGSIRKVLDFGSVEKATTEDITERDERRHIDNEELEADIIETKIRTEAKARDDDDATARFLEFDDEDEDDNDNDNDNDDSVSASRSRSESLENVDCVVAVHESDEEFAEFDLDQYIPQNLTTSS